MLEMLSRRTILTVMTVALIATLMAYPFLASQRATAEEGEDFGSNGAVHPSKARITSIPVELRKVLFNHTGRYGFVAAGVGLRNVGHGTINLRVPHRASLVSAYLFWAVIGGDTASGREDIAVMDGERVAGTLIGEDLSPCWIPPKIRAYYADVFRVVVRTGGPVDAHEIGGFASYLRTGEDPWPSVQPTTTSEVTPQIAPMMEGASLVLIFSSDKLPIRNLVVLAGCVSLCGVPGILTATHPAKLAAVAETSAVIGDGQVAGVGMPNSKSYVVDSTTLQTNTLNGDDPTLQSYGQFKGGLWDTKNFQVGAVIPNGATSHTVTVNAANDCLTWVAYIYVV